MADAPVVDPRRRRPWKAASMSLLFGAGFGQIYNKQYVKAAILIPLFLGSVILTIVVVWNAAVLNYPLLAQAAGDPGQVKMIYDKMLADVAAARGGWYGEASLLIWFLSIVDGYVAAGNINRRLEIEARSTPDRPEEDPTPSAS